MSAPTVIDLFSGAGGATEGLIQAGFRALAAVENDPDAVNTFRKNHSDVSLISGDITEIDVSGLREQLELKRGELTLLKSCPPCQGFSSLGRQRVDDPRNDLVEETWRFVEEFRPQALLMENVPGLQRDERFIDLMRRATEDGYGVASYIVDAVRFGVPQRRRRLILIAIKGRPNDALPASIQDVLPDGFGTEPPTAGQVIASAGELNGEDPVHRARTPRAATLERIKAIPPGGSRFDLPEEHQLACHTTLKSRAATSSYGRIRADQPAPTMTTRCTTPACGRFIHPTEDRGITLREAALLQTFPPTYRFEGGYDSIERQIGNAVPVRMAWALGLAVRALLADN